MAAFVLVCGLATVVVSAVAGGLLRAGVAWPVLQGSPWLGRSAGMHAALMLSAFLGSVIAVERAAALRLRWPWLAPLASSIGGFVLVLGPFEIAAALGVFAAALSVAVHVLVWTRQRAAHTALLVVASLAWLVGNGVFAATREATPALAWWFALPVLTIAAERLEMTRLTQRPAWALPLLLAIVAALLLGAAWPSPAGGAGFGCALSALALWLFVFDIARRTVHAAGLARYMALCLLAGYVWLALAGAAWLGVAFGCPGRDLALHALGLGFIASMVFGHAPVILPAVARVKLRFGAWFYIPLLALHASLALRLIAGIGNPALRSAGAALNAVALALFALTLLGSALAWREPAHRAGKSTRGSRH